MGGRIFECLDAVINRYRKEQIVEGYTLQHPVKRFFILTLMFCSYVSIFQLVVDGSKQLDWVPENQKAKSEAEKIYATLRECRDQAGLKKMRGIKHQGYLHRKSDKAAKKWKLLYFVLLVDGTDTHLYLYENPKRTKPKGLIDLSCAYLYQVCITNIVLVFVYHRLIRKFEIIFICVQKRWEQKTLSYRHTISVVFYKETVKLQEKYIFSIYGQKISLKMKITHFKNKKIYIVSFKVNISLKQNKIRFNT